MKEKGYNFSHLIFFTTFNIFSVSFLLIFTSYFFFIDLLFFIVLITINVLIWYQLNSKPNIALSSYNIFSYLFFYIAPLVQLNLMEGEQNNIFPNTLYFSYELVVKSIISIIIFNAVFLGSLNLFKNKNLYIDYHKKGDQLNDYKLSAFVMLILSLCSIPFLNSILATQANLEQDFKAQYLIFKKVIFFFPLLPALYYTKYRSNSSTILLVIAIALLIIFKNPLFEKRNALGPIYLALLTVYMPSIWKSNLKSLLLLFFAMVIGFPITSIITHNKDITLDQIYSLSGQDYLNMVSEVFISLHYDAFSNVMASILYYEENNVVIGKQLLGSLLFFIPKSLWIDKPTSSGIEIGNYLIDNFYMWFNNLSAPLVAEGWLNFGMLGVILFAIALGYIVQFFQKWLCSNDFLKHAIAIYFSYHLIFLLRGDLMNGVAYFLGPFIAIYLLPKFIANFNTPKKSSPSETHQP